MEETALNNLDEETNELSKKSKRELINIKIDDTNILKNTEIFIGKELEKEMKSFNLTPNSVQLSPFFDSVKKFHKTACKYLKKYFETSMKSDVLDNMSALSRSRSICSLAGS